MKVVEVVARQLHREYRAAFKALHEMRKFTTNCVNEHDHGWKFCHKKDYFEKRAKMLLKNRSLEYLRVRL